MSHIAVHTWPEHRLASVDLFTCGDRVEPRRAFPVLRRGLAAARLTVSELDRGLLKGPAAIPFL